MATAEEFKFPDEKPADDTENQKFDISVEGDVELEVVDDTPDKDKGRMPLGFEPEPVTDEELAQFNEKTRKRIKDLSHGYHDERREKERALREREELERAARFLAEENKKLKQYVSNGETVYSKTLLTAAEAKLANAARELKEAHESYDTDAIVAAQQKLNEAQWELQSAKNFRPTPLQDENSGVQHVPAAPETVKPDANTIRWQARNQWFGEDDEMTSLALAVHKKLVASGVDPSSSTYFERIDARMREVFPDYFGETKRTAPPERQERTKPASVVAPSTRSNGAKKVTLTTTQVAVAKKLGVPLELYVQNLEKLRAQNG